MKKTVITIPINFLFTRFVRLILLFTFILLQSSFIDSDKLYYRLSKMFETNKDKCLEFVEYKIRNNSKNYAPYFFALKLELDKYKDLAYVGFIYNWSEHDDDVFDEYIESMHKMIGYTYNIYDLSDEEILYDKDCFMLFEDML